MVIRKKSLAFLRAKSKRALANPELVSFALMAPSPSAAYDLSIKYKDHKQDLAESCRYLAMIRRDYGDAVMFEEIVTALEDWSLSLLGITLRNDIYHNVLHVLAARTASMRGMEEPFRYRSLVSGDVAGAIMDIDKATTEGQSGRMKKVVADLVDSIDNETRRQIVERTSQDFFLAEDFHGLTLLALANIACDDDPSNDDLAFVVVNIPNPSDVDHDPTSVSLKVPEWPYHAVATLLERSPTMDELIMIVCSVFRVPTLGSRPDDYAGKAWAEIRKRLTDDNGSITPTDLLAIIAVSDDDDIARSARFLLPVRRRRR